MNGLLRAFSDTGIVALFSLFATVMLASIDVRIAQEIQVKPAQVAAAIALLDEGATVPFVARYRKEVTGGLDDTQLRTLEERLVYLRELEERRATVIKSVEEQGKMTDALRDQLLAAETKQVLEDVYLPYKPKLRTKAQIAREVGLEPLALLLLENPQRHPETEAAVFVNAEKGVADVKAALDGARQILMERFAEDAELTGVLRDYLQQHAVVSAEVIAGKEEVGAKFSDYFVFTEAWRTMPSHRALALLRGRNEGVLNLALVLDYNDATKTTPQTAHCEGRIAQRFGIAQCGRPADAWLAETVKSAWRLKLLLRLRLDLFNTLRERAEVEAIRVFAANLRDLLLAAPAGPRPTMGLDPGLRTGVKVAIVSATGKLLDTATIYPHEPRRDWDGSIATLAALAARHRVDLIAIGNGTASRETVQLALDLAKRHPELKLTQVTVSEAGASVYSASATAAKEFPELDVSLRGAVSIARRLQDPLAELVKIDPKAIGVGQYQHDVAQAHLARALDAVVEDCVNAVGVDVNTASVSLLARVAGLNTSIAANIVAYRDEHGRMASRDALKRVPRLGPKTFEQAAGFLRVMNGENPLDASAVHPEAYPVVQKILADLQKSAREVIGETKLLRSLSPAKYTDERFGLPTVADILKELDKPGRDPRPEFRTAQFQEDVNELSDLQPGMVLEGVVTNVANFGAFVDVGVHQDGLVHVSQLADKFVADPKTVVKVGQIVRVKVLEVDAKRRRIGLSMRLAAAAESAHRAPPREAKRPPSRDKPAPAATAMAAAFAALRRK